MIILVHTAYDDATVAGNLGRPEYSYHFVLREFRPLLERIGQVKDVGDPTTEVDAIYSDCVARGVACVFLSFMPPNKVPLGLACPTIPVFAWEYDTIPHEAFGGKPRNDWRKVLSLLGCAITHSRFAAAVTRRMLGRDYPVQVTPAPLWDRFEAQRKHRSGSIGVPRTICFEGLLVDSLEVDLRLYSKDAEWAVEPAPLPLPVGCVYGEQSLTLDGVVYTAVLNPGDGRKNWMDMIGAFCVAFGNEPGATLVLKLSHQRIEEWVPKMLEYVHRTGSPRCRVAIVHGYLADADYHALMDATSYAVNTSRGEGQCLPLMEYMSCGKPAVAPRHTAMADYVDEGCAFVVQSAPKVGTWPHDMRQAFRTLREDIDFDSLVTAYRASYHVARYEPDVYRHMGDAAIEALRRYCSLAALEPGLRLFIENAVASSHM